MKILLVYPPVTLHKLDVSPPTKAPLIGLSYVGAALKNAGHEVKILDCMVSSFYKYKVDQDFSRYGLNDSQILENIRSFAPDVVGVACMFTAYSHDAHNIARIVKDNNRSTLVIFGGAHASTFPESTMKDPNVDLVVVGEGEITVVEAVRCCAQNQGFSGLQGSVHRHNGSIVKEPPRPFIEDLDSIPFPARELVSEGLDVIREEQQKNKFFMRRPVGYILTSRGCPNGCYFCSVKLIWSRKWRMRSARNVVDEIEFLKNRYGYREFHFIDDNSSVSKERMHEICDELIKRKLNVKVATPTGIAIGTLDKEILAKMRRAGFYRLCFGIESGDPETQKIIKKRVDLAKAKKVIAEANKLGFWTSGTFIIGFPHETEKEINATIEFAKSSNMDFAIFYLLVPQPGTEVYAILKSQGLIDLDSYIDPASQEWYKISITYSNGFKTRHFTNSELQAILAGAYRGFLMHKLFSVRTYINIISKVRSIEEARYLAGLLTIPLRMIAKMLLGSRLSNVSMHNRHSGLKDVEREIKSAKFE